MSTCGVSTVRTFRHKLSNYRLTTADMGYIVPIGIWEILPTDVVQGSTSMMIRMSPMTAPIMHPIQAETFTVFTPNRLLWNKETDTDAGTWEDFITGGPDGMDSNTPPTIPTTGVKGDLLDHLGLPLVAGIDVNAMPIRAVNLTFNEWFRDQDLVAKRDLDEKTLPQAAWHRDYFTTARPWTQKGPNVTLPLGKTAPVLGLGVKGSSSSSAGPYNQSDGSSVNPARVFKGTTTDHVNVFEDAQNTGYPDVFVDLSAADGANINDARRAYAIQRFQEARAAWGSRYTEYLKSIGANPADARLQRPELIATGRARLNISEVLQTSPEASPQTGAYGVGDMYGHGIAGLKSHTFRRRFEEHGYLITYLVVRPRTVYSQGVDKHWLKKDKEDYFQKELQYIGQQNVHMNEIYADPTHTDDDIFGYQDRYREYRETPSKVCGDFRDTLDFWHLARKFDQAPALNEAFITSDPSKRIFNVQNEDTLWIAAQHKMVARRQVAKNAVGRIL